MVMPERGAEVGVHIPAFADPLDRGNLTLLMNMQQRPLESDRIAVDLADTGRLESIHLIHPHA